MSISPSSSQIDRGQQLTLTAALTNDAVSGAVQWSLNGPGSLINVSGTTATYVAPPSVSTPQNATVMATSMADPSKSASAQILVNTAPQIAFRSFPDGTTGIAYNQSINETGGSLPLRWSVPDGALPNGLRLDSGTGLISGTPSGGGTWYFSVQVTDAAGVSAVELFFTIAVDSTASTKNPVPFIDQPLVPDTVLPGNPGFTLTINGAGFVPGAAVRFNGTALPTTFISNSQLTATVQPAFVASPRTAGITVVNPSPAGPASNVVFLPVSAPETSLSLSNALGSPIPPPPFSGAPNTLAIGDFTGNGKLDLATNYATTEVTVLLGNGDGSFAAGPGSPIMMPCPPFNCLHPIVNSISVGDFNNSGRLGLAVVDVQESNVNILLGNGDGSFLHSPAFVETGGFAATLAVGDFNGDGNLDMAVAHFLQGQPVLIETGFSDGAFTPGARVGINSPINAIVAGDFNGDGKLDFGFTDVTNSLTVFLGNGDGTFAQANGSPVTVGKSPIAMVACDFNGDGRLDLAIANQTDNTVTILLGNGDGSFSAAAGSPISVGNEPASIAVGDFTGSGKPALAVANLGSNNITVLLGNGDGTFTTASGSPFPAGMAPSLLAAGDFNGSGRLGLAVTNVGDHTISILVQH